ncbi:undecaprenyl-diphosphate phosphatase [Lysobacteraceae bacterium NML120232]|nr:undecaprenyl-diphosphate phosphatase [Xanthomonadaceae bacterium NML08-0793]PJK12426.1 undecaprenyl-diphosphate phosphatase [Xanthomonadaceae bacterium NML120232]
MSDLLSALLLGIIEGITEFLPISSTGHLLIAQHWLGARSDLFNIAIQAGAILAVVFIYWRKLLALAAAFAGRPLPDAEGEGEGEAANVRAARSYLLKLGLAFGVTAIGGLLVKKLGWELPDTVGPIAWALIIGAFWMLLAEQLATRRARAIGERREIAWFTAVLVGIAQVVAGVFPGTSRSASTIFVALLAGTTSRTAATEFAFLVGIPTMFAATGYELISLWRSGGMADENWSALAVAFFASMATAFVAVKWLLRYIQSHRFTAFACYRLLLGAALLLCLPANA